MPKLCPTVLAQSFPYGFDRNAVVDSVEEAFDDDVHRLKPGQSATHAIEDLFFVDASGSRSVRAADVVGLNFERWNRIAAARWS